MILHAFWPGHPEDVAYPSVSIAGRTSVPGVLLDDSGFPAVVHGEDGVVLGHLLAIDPDGRDAALGALDAHHQVGSSSHERTIAIAMGMDGRSIPVHAWNWTGTTDLPGIVPGDWSNRRSESQ